MKITKIKEILLNGLVLLVSVWTVLASSFQLTIIGFHFTNNEKGIKTVQDWFNSNIDGYFKKS